MQLVSFFLNSDSVKSKFVLLYIRNFHFVYNTIIIESLHVVIKFDFASLIKKNVHTNTDCEDTAKLFKLRNIMKIAIRKRLKRTGTI